MEALKGIRIVEFSSAIAGPYAATLLGYLGAEVIKVESATWPDLARYTEFNSSRPKVPPPETASHYNCLNLNKKCIRLNIRDSKAIDIAKNLIKECDIVLENMRPGVLAKRGLDYESVKEIKPDIIYLSSCANGQSGPWKDFAGFAPNFAALSGLSGITGYADSMPSEYMGSVDFKSAYTAAAAILTALIYRNRTSKGQFIDLSSAETIAAVCGDQFLSAVLTGKRPMRNGNRIPQAAPHDAYKCAGDDRWVSIAVFNNLEWRAFCDTIDNPELAEDTRFNSLEARIENIDELDALITAWTSDKNPKEVTDLLQRAGIAAAPTMSGDDLFNDEHLKARGVFVENEHPVLGKDWITAPPWKLSETPAEVRRHAPLLGEHNEEIYGGLLGMSVEKIKQLEEEKVIF